jgi:hypothetical protein
MGGAGGTGDPAAAAGGAGANGLAAQVLAFE